MVWRENEISGTARIRLKRHHIGISVHKEDGHAAAEAEAADDEQDGIIRPTHNLGNRLYQHGRETPTRP